MKTLLIVALAIPLALADPPPSVPTMHAEARVVQIDVVVTDSHGKRVTDLTKQDFAIIDEGKPRAIDIFSIERTGADRPQNCPAGGSSAIAAVAAAYIFKSQSPTAGRAGPLHCSHPRSDQYLC